jgi:long-chain fatty acid transport protein
MCTAVKESPHRGALGTIIMKISHRAAVAALSFVSLSSHAEAGGFALREQSAIGQGMSFAGVAAGSGGLSSMFWNPAVSAEYNEFGFISESNVNLILPQAEAEALGTSSGNIGKLAIVPAGNMSYGLTEDITLGLTTGAPFGLTTNANNTWAGAFRGDKSAVMTFNATPSVSYRVNDMLSIGVGVQIQYMSVDINSRNPLTGGTEFFAAEGDDIGFGFTAGILFEPTDTTDIGIGFRSAVKHKLEGEGFFGSPLAETDISAKFTAPEIVTLGIRQQVSDQLSLSAGVEWTNWSRFKELTVDPIAFEEFNWKDGWFASLGAEYAYNDRLILRAGAAYESSPVPDETRSVRAPDNDRYWLSLGASYKVSDSMTAHLAYSHIFIKDGDVDLPPDLRPPLVTSFEQSVDVITIGMTRDW